jgi:hypothetical protein
MESMEMAVITALILLVTAITPPRVLAQHTEYKLIDLRTFGGPQSFFNSSANAFPAINTAGTRRGFGSNCVPRAHDMQPCCSSQLAEVCRDQFGQPAPLHGEFELAIMIEPWTEEMHGSD